MGEGFVVGEVSVNGWLCTPPVPAVAAGPKA